MELKSEEELEALRLRMLADAQAEWAAAARAGRAAVGVADFAPGTTGAHEALHATWMMREIVGDQVVSHPAVMANPLWFRLAARAAEVLNGLHTLIVAEHQAAAGVRLDTALPAAEPGRFSGTLGGARGGGDLLN